MPQYVNSWFDSMKLSHSPHHGRSSGGEAGNACSDFVTLVHPTDSLLPSLLNSKELHDVAFPPNSTSSTLPQSHTNSKNSNVATELATEEHETLLTSSGSTSEAWLRLGGNVVFFNSANVASHLFSNFRREFACTKSSSSALIFLIKCIFPYPTLNAYFTLQLVRPSSVTRLSGDFDNTSIFSRSA